MRTRLRVAYNEETRTMYEHMEEGYNGPLSMEDCADAQIIDEVECVGEIPSCEITPSMARGQFLQSEVVSPISKSQVC